MLQREVGPSQSSAGRKPGKKSAQNHLGLPRIVGFTLGDFACNLFWQSVSLFLLFYYTDVAGIAPAVAGFIYMIASIWDGLCDPIMGTIADRTRSRWGRYRPYILFGSVPVCLAFSLAYYKPPLTGVALATFFLITHVVFRTAYTAVSIPFTAISARITSDSRTRSTVAGFRMIFAVAAGLVVAYFTLPLATYFGHGHQAKGFFGAAIIFALIAAAIFPIVFLAIREPEAQSGTRPNLTYGQNWAAVLHNRAFWMIMIGIACTVGVVTAFGKSILYYFKYYIGDAAAGPVALSWGAAAGFVILPVWILIERLTGKRTAWFIATAAGLAGFIFFAVTDLRTVQAMTVFTVYMQFPLLGLAMNFWSMLPDTVEYGEWVSGKRAEGFIFGLAQLFLKIALGVGAGGFGLALEAVGYHANVAQTPQTLAGLKMIMVAFPIALLVAGAIAMIFYPMRRGGHEAILDKIAEREAAVTAKETS